MFQENSTFFSDELMPYCYSTNPSVAAYAMGAMTNIAIATSGVGGALDSSAEVTEVGSIVVEYLMVMDIAEIGGYAKLGENPFKVGIPFNCTTCLNSNALYTNSINVRCMRTGVTVVCLFVCLSVCVLPL